MRNHPRRREPVFEDETHPAYIGPNDHSADRHEPNVPSRRFLAAPGRLLMGFVLLGATVAFITNALYLQKAARPSSLIDLTSMWRGLGTLNPFTALVRANGESQPALESAPQPPRRPDKVEAAPVPVPAHAPILAAPKVSVPVSVVASADPKQVFAPPQPIPDLRSNDPVGSLVAQSMPHPEKGILGVQRALNKMGYGPVSPDGLKSSALRDAVLRFQKDRHLPATGEIDPTTKPLLAKASGLTLD